MKQTVFLIDSRRIHSAIRMVEAEILVGKKRTWAVTPHPRKQNGRRLYLLGTSAFFSYVSARRMKLARMEDLVNKLGMLERLGLHRYAADVRTAWIEYKKTGVLH